MFLKKRDIIRIDYSDFELIKREDGGLSFKMRLDPKRYEFMELDGKKGYFDKYDNLFLTIEAIESLVTSMQGEPFFISQPFIETIENYTKQRIEHLNDIFESKNIAYELCDKSEDFLNSLECNKMRFVILSIDLKGSTKMSQQLTPEQNAKIVALFSSEISQIINKFNGYVLKYLGDGIIAYFPEPNYMGMHDNAINCAMWIKYFILKGLNEIFLQKGLPSLNFRIGLDSGEAIILTVGSKPIKMHKDLIGQTINLATKIQSIAGANKIMAGETTIKNLHYAYRDDFTKIKLPDDWEYVKLNDNDRYCVYESKY